MYHCYLLLFSPGDLSFFHPYKYVSSLFSFCLSVLNPLFSFFILLRNIYHIFCPPFILLSYFPSLLLSSFSSLFLLLYFFPLLFFPVLFLSYLLYLSLFLLVSLYSLPFIHLLCSFICYLSPSFALILIWFYLFHMIYKCLLLRV